MMHTTLNPTSQGRYGEFGGQYVPELLIAPLQELLSAFDHYRQDRQFKQELQGLLTTFAARPTPLTQAQHLPARLSLPKIVFKREDCLHTGAHKINNALGQVLLAKKMGKSRVVAETGAGQHGVATATACAHLGLRCTIYMGQQDMQRQKPNVLRMRLLGAEVLPVGTGLATLKEAVNQAMRDWAENLEQSYYCLGSALGPHPYPQIVAYFQSVIGIEARAQCLAQHQQLPSHIIACVGGGSNAIGTFDAFLEDDCALFGVEAGGTGTTLGQHASRFLDQRIGVLHGCESHVLQDLHGQIAATHSISAGLDYPMIGPHNAYLHASLRVHYGNCSDQQALKAVEMLAQLEGIIPALESAHALGFLIHHPELFTGATCVLITISGRGDKDLATIANHQFTDGEITC